MRRPPDETAILQRWRAEELTLVELLGQLQACGWSRRDVYAFVEREAGGAAEAPAAPPSWKNRAKLTNY